MRRANSRALPVADGAAEVDDAHVSKVGKALEQQLHATLARLKAKRRVLGGRGELSPECGQRHCLTVQRDPGPAQSGQLLERSASYADVVGVYRILLAAVIAAAASLNTSPVVAAPFPDSDAPSGAPAGWLPDEEWVNERWLPFDEADLIRELGGDTQEYFLYFKQGKTLLDLARKRGVPTVGLASRVVRPQRRRLTTRQFAVVRDRTARVLRQSHLAEHMLGHHFHQDSLWSQLYSIVGGPENPRRPLFESALVNGVPPEAARGRALDALREGGLRGVRQRAVSPAQNAATQRYHCALIDDLMSNPRL